MSTDREIAQFVANALIEAELTTPTNTEPLTEATISVKYLPRYELKDLEQLQIVVAPRTRSQTPLSRATQKREHTIQVCVMQKCKPDSELMAELLDLVETIDDTLADVAAALPGRLRPATWTSSETSLYDIEQLEQHGVFKSVITLNYILNR